MSLPGVSLTAARQKVYPRHIRGRFRRWRNGISTVLQALLFVLPWLQWQGRQALLIDLPGRRLFLGSWVLHPQDGPIFHLLLIAAGLTLFLVSALAGRMWCGYACPQTLLTQAFIMVERFWEGDRAARIRLDRQPWSQRWRRKLGKWSCWTGMGAFLGLTFAGYFLPIRQIAGQMLQGQMSLGTAATLAFFTLLSLGNFGYFREQFCHYLCPYARFQGAMLDSQSLVVAYDQERGEPRGKLAQPGRGACIDCGLCVQVCPMGIDIRKGLQLECIACTACIDACDQIMDKIDQPRGLVGYSSQSGARPSWKRPRVLVYFGLLCSLGVLLALLLLQRGPVGLDVTRVIQPGGQLASVTPQGQIGNLFRVHLISRRAQTRQVWLETQGLDQAQLLGQVNPLTLEGGQVEQAQVVVLLPPGTRSGVHRFYFLLKSSPLDPPSARKEATFVVP